MVKTEAYPTVSDNPTIQAFYEHMRSEGTGHLLAELLAFQQPPGSHGTERAFLEGRYNGSDFDDKDVVGNRFKQMAKAAGVNTHGKVYAGPVARYPGDPLAWVSGKDDVLARAKALNLNLDGGIKYKAPPSVDKPTPKLADDIVDRFVQQRIKDDPKCAKDVEGVKQEVIKKHGSPYGLS